MKNIVLIGRGAVGAVYATKLHDTLGSDTFRVAVDDARKSRYEAQQFLFNGKQYNFNYFTPKEEDEKADLLIIATKWGGYADAMALCDPLVGADTLVLPLLNGLGAYRMACERWGADKVLRGFYIGNTASRSVGVAEVVQDGHYRTNFGDDINVEPYSKRVARIKDLFDKTGIKYTIPENMVTAQWQKFIINIGTNQPTGLYRYSYGELIASAEALGLAHNLMGEACAIAQSLGVTEADQLFERANQAMRKFASHDYSSMAQDVIAGRSTEVDIFAGEVVRLGAELGVATPFHEQFIAELKVSQGL